MDFTQLHPIHVSKVLMGWIRFMMGGLGGLDDPCTVLHYTIQRLLTGKSLRLKESKTTQYNI
jgi:hypothetical protein